jgi:hypothetical protein
MSRPDADPIVLRYRGPARGGSPARDLTRSEVRRITYRRKFAEEGRRPTEVTPDDIRRVTASLVASGSYTRAKKES